MRIHKYLVATLTIFLVYSVAGAKPSPPDKMKPEEVVAKHLASIGPADALAAIKSIVALGDAKALSRSAAVRDLAGIAQIASEGDKVVLAMIFNSNNYPYEKAGFDGQKMTVSLLRATGQRSALGEFLMSKESILKQGLFGGVLSSAWPLLNVTAKNPKLSYSGMKKMENGQVHELKYTPAKGGGDLKISLFFDGETFRHVRTEYSYTTSARMGARPGTLTASRDTGVVGGAGTDTGSQTLYRYKLVEEFSDFKVTNDVTLPHAYTIRLSVDAQAPLLLEWALNFNQFTFNGPIDTTAFSVSETK